MDPTAARIVIAVVLLALVALAFLFWRAPEGWQDDSGFHVGETPRGLRGR